MELKFSSPHLSIRDFPQIEIPDFTVITGRNGSGKTHLLNALQNGRIACTKNGGPIQHGQNEIRLYSWNNMIPEDHGIFSSETIRSERQQSADHIKNFMNNHQTINWIRQHAQAFGLNALSDTELLRSSLNELLALNPNPSAGQFINMRDTHLHQQENSLRNNLGQRFAPLQQAARNKGKSIFSLSENEILFPSVYNYGSSDLFQQSFARLFVEYRDLCLRNDLVDLNYQRGNSSDSALSKEDFQKLHGPPPWEFVNSSLEQAGLDFAVNKPDHLGFTPFECTLTKKTTGDEIQFQNLSSGEKIIMSFAFCLYYSTDRRQITTYPKLLLLDEIDAPLHPTMTRSLLRTIKEVLVGQYGISVIATTHSPSTVALSPDESIHIMTNGREGLQKRSKAGALNLLTEGVPTISLSYSGRRQVFVESNADAETYSELYQIAKKNLASERSLEFISTGIKTGAGVDRNTGCTLVKKLVEAITDAGNTSIFGILDWDGKHQSSNRLFVLAEGSRNGLENVILDPLIIATTLCRNFPKEKASIGIGSNVSYIDFSKWNKDQLQPVVTKVCEAVLERTSTTEIDVQYVGGLTLKIDLEYFTIDDHVLEGKILKAFPCLNSLSRNRGAGALMQEIIKTVIADNYGILPIAAHQLLEAILNKDAH